MQTPIQNPHEQLTVNLTRLDVNNLMQALNFVVGSNNEPIRVAQELGPLFTKLAAALGFPGGIVVAPEDVVDTTKN